MTALQQPTRRGLLLSAGALLIAAPAIVKASSLMSIRPLPPQPKPVLTGQSGPSLFESLEEAGWNLAPEPFPTAGLAVIKDDGTCEVVWDNDPCFPEFVKRHQDPETKNLRNGRLLTLGA